VGIVWDTSSSGGQYWPTYHSIVRQVCSTLASGDRVEIISAHAGTPKLRVSHCIRTGDSQELAGIYLLLENITCPLLADARLEKAVEMACKRISDPSAAGKDGPAMLIILTNGNLSSQEVKAIRQVAEQFSKPGRRLYVTGTRSTDRDLLISASQNILEWSLLDQVNAANWVRKLREAVAATETKGASSTHVIDASPVKDIRSATSSNTTIRSVPEPTDIRTGTPERPISTKVLVEVSSGESRRSPTDFTPVPPEREQPIASPATQSATQHPAPVTKPTEEGKPLQKNQPSPTPPSLWARSMRLLARYWLWPVLGGTLFLIVLGCILVQGNQRARQWTTKAKAGLKDNRVPTDPLVARLNGQIHHLGRIDHLPVIHVGSGPKNTIRIIDKGISARQLKLYRRGRDLMVQNIGTQAVTVNSLALKPRAKQHLVLPAVIQLTESMKMSLSLLRPKETTPTEGSQDHGQDKPQ